MKIIITIREIFIHTRIKKKIIYFIDRLERSRSGDSDSDKISF